MNDELPQATATDVAVPELRTIIKVRTGLNEHLMLIQTRIKELLNRFRVAPPSKVEETDEKDSTGGNYSQALTQGNSHQDELQAGIQSLLNELDKYI